jgi:hypothetical protein
LRAWWKGRSTPPRPNARERPSIPGPLTGGEPVLLLCYTPLVDTQPRRRAHNPIRLNRCADYGVAASSPVDTMAGSQTITRAAKRRPDRYGQAGVSDRVAVVSVVPGRDVAKGPDLPVLDSRISNTRHRMCVSCSPAICSGGHSDNILSRLPHRAVRKRVRSSGGMGGGAHHGHVAGPTPAFRSARLRLTLNRRRLFTAAFSPHTSTSAS